MSNVGSYSGSGFDFDSIVATANNFANTFDKVISIEIIHVPSSSHPYKFVVFGYWSSGEPNIVGSNSEKFINFAYFDEEYLFERPLKDGRLMIYKNNKEDITKLIEYLTEIGVDDPKLLERNTWEKARCTGGKRCTTKSCDGGRKCRKCSTGGGTHCCCLKV